ncbi:putative transcriptional regulator YwtF [Sporotomaculum syntrophicum]|uniref:Transcriptional regulator YwtF n=1 Tax=Sporotomaculum syntrophicum TaxID=182264 RepID=A0A9D3AY62_9FIRM|nr:LCP family protein [Sporotomaculum syntrophicum]KAF1085722.1 putative transcriptional regulator YwtF [Sporotomaculum syntrophicum]
MFKKAALLVLLFIIIPSAFAYSLINKIDHVRINKTDKALGIKTADGTNLPKQEGIVNIALFGLDRYQRAQNGRSDTIIICTIDFAQQTIKMSSIMRDLIVPIEGHGEDKINHAYAYGGPQLALKTINQNFNTSISDFVTVDFRTLKEAVDALGGITIDVQDEEREIINDYMDDRSKYITKSGKQLLDGEQVLAYVSNRKFDNDFVRIDRQKEVLAAVFNKVQKNGLTSLPNYVARILPYVETSMTKTAILNLGMSCFTQQVNILEHERFPQDGYWQNANIAGVYYLQSDLAATKQQLHDFILSDARAR